MTILKCSDSSPYDRVIVNELCQKVTCKKERKCMSGIAKVRKLSLPKQPKGIEEEGILLSTN